MSIHDDRFVFPNSGHETHEPVDYARWLVHLITWDGIVPGIMFSIPILVRRFGPQNNDRAIVMAVVLALIVGIFLRFGFGMRHINENYCGTTVKLLQRIALLIMIFLLVVFEAVLAVLPQGPLVLADFAFLAVFGAVYLPVMASVLYPGRRPLHDTEGDDPEEHEDCEQAHYDSGSWC